MDSHDDASFVLFYYNVVHLGGMTIFTKQPEKAIIFVQVQFFQILEYEGYHILPPAFLLPHTQGALRIEALDMQGLRPTLSNHKNHKQITREPIIYRSIV